MAVKLKKYKGIPYSGFTQAIEFEGPDNLSPNDPVGFFSMIAASAGGGFGYSPYTSIETGLLQSPDNAGIFLGIDSGSADFIIGWTFKVNATFE